MFELNAEGTTRFLTWNILKGGGARMPGILREIGALSPQFVALTEVTGNHVPRLRQGLTEIGFNYIETPCPEGGTNSVLFAAKVPFDVLAAEVTDDHERWLAVQIPSIQVEVLCVHIPGSDDDKIRSDGPSLVGVERKDRFWREVVRHAEARKDRRVVLLGDFNTGRNDIDKTTGGAAFKLTHYIGQLGDAGYVDAWRELHPETRQYTWFTWQRGVELNGFRLDYVYVSAAMRDGIIAAQHVDHVRGQVKDGGLSDHAILVVDLRIERALSGVMPD